MLKLACLVSCPARALTTMYVPYTGIKNSPGRDGDGSAATSARLFYPNAVGLDTIGNIYIADVSNQAVRMLVNPGI